MCELGGGRVLDLVVSTNPCTLEVIQFSWIEIVLGVH